MTFRTPTFSRGQISGSPIELPSCRMVNMFISPRSPPLIIWTFCQEPLQVFLGLGWGGGKISEKAYYMEKIVPIKRKKVNSHKKCFVQLVNFLHISFVILKKVKGIYFLFFRLGVGVLGDKATSSELIYGLYG